MNKLLNIIIIILIVLIALLVTIPQWALKKPIKMKVGHLPDIPNYPLYLGNDRYIFKDANLDVNLVEFSSYTEAMDSFKSNGIDAFFCLPWSLLLKHGSPEDMKVFLSYYSSPTTFSPYGALIVNSDSKLKKMKQLGKKKVGCRTDPFEYTLLKKTLVDSIQEKYITLEQLPFSTMLDSLREKKIDALLIYEPWLTKSLERKDYRILSKDPICALFDPYPICAAIFSSNFIKTEMEGASIFLHQIDSIIDLKRENSAEARNSLTNYTKVTRSESRKISLLEVQKLGEITEDAIQKLADFYFAEGLIEDSVKVSDFFLSPEPRDQDK